MTPYQHITKKKYTIEKKTSQNEREGGMDSEED